VSRSSALAAPALAGARVCVVVPAYRVAEQIERVLRGIPAWIERVIVVDDASPDDTRGRVERAGDARVQLLRHEQNRGVGAAMQTGFAEALRQGFDIVVKMDGDDQMDPAHLAHLVEPLVLGHADMVKCNRYTDLRGLRAMPLVRQVGNAGLTFLVKLASGYWNIFDPANGYFAVRSDVLRKLDLGALPERYFFESGFLIELGILRALVRDVPIPARYGDEHSSLSPLAALIEFPPKLARGLARRLFWRYFVHDFNALSVFLLLGVPLFVFGLAYGSVQYVQNQITNRPAPAGVVMLAAMPIILGVQLILQAIVLDIQNVPKVPLCAPLGALHEPARQRSG
jgi:dolichol-phosphate mannosyltransferase